MASFIVFCFGLIIGSFLNALVYRFGREESVLSGRSRCPDCGHMLSWRDLIPLLSFAMLGGTCRYCKERISWQYPIVEIITGGIFLLISLSVIPISGTGVDLLRMITLWIAASALIAIAVYDIQHFLIPDVFIVIAGGAALALALLSAYYLQSWDPVQDAALAGAGAGAFFFAFHYYSRGRWMGFGDVKLAIAIGLLLGFPAIAVALFAAFAGGAFTGLALMAFGKKTMKSELPFAPFLVAGTFMALFVGEALVEWYVNLALIA